MFLSTTIDCLYALAPSIDEQTTAFVPNVLARAAMESAAQAWWMLEPGIGARRRVIRSVLIHANSARKLRETARKSNPSVPVTHYGEDPDTVRSYAHSIGLSYVCNDNGVEAEAEKLPGYTQRAKELGEATRMVAAYNVYSGAAHAEWYAVAQGWRPVADGAASTTPWTRRPDREAVWAAALASAGFAVVPVSRALTLLGLNARLAELNNHLIHVSQLERQMQLPTDWYL
ncbi:MAG: hypothetical protein QOH97_5764 [Actinoplanes sp.]|nr:hypothetical protein [Actinoplanes sp.]